MNGFLRFVFLPLLFVLGCLCLEVHANVVDPPQDVSAKQEEKEKKESGLPDLLVNPEVLNPHSESAPADMDEPQGLVEDKLAPEVKLPLPGKTPPAPKLPEEIELPKTPALGETPSASKLPENIGLPVSPSLAETSNISGLPEPESLEGLPQETPNAPALPAQTQTETPTPPTPDEHPDDTESLLSETESEAAGAPIVTTLPTLTRGTNILVNPQFGRPNNDLSLSVSYWQNSHLLDTGATYTHPYTCDGRSSTVLRVTPKATSDKFGYLAFCQTVPVEPNKEYTFSANIKADNLVHGAAFLNTQQLDSNLTPVPINQWTNNRDSRVTGDSDWTKRQVTIRTGPYTRFLKVFLQVDHRSYETSGSGWFDQVKLEPGPVSSSFYPEPTTTLSHHGPVTQVIDPSGSTVSLKQTKHHLIFTDGRGHVHRFRVNSDDKIVSYTPPSGPRKVTYQYDESGQVVSRRLISDDHVYESKVVPEAESDSESEVDCDAEEKLVLPGSLSVTEHREPGRFLQRRDIRVGSAILIHRYGHNSDQQNTLVTTPAGLTYQLDYDAHNRVVVVTNPNSTGAAFDYDASQRIRRVRGWTLVYEEPIVDEVSTYDGNSNRVGLIDHTYVAGYQAVKYSYDPLNQLILEEDSRLGGLNKYDYDVRGNRIRKSIGGMVTEYAYDTDNKLIAVDGEPYEYDKDGRLTQDQKYRYAWDDCGNLTHIYLKGMDSLHIRYSYDPLGRRTHKHFKDITKEYIYDGDSGRVLYEKDQHGNLLCYYTYSADNKLLGITANNDHYTYHYNTHGDVVALTDENGDIKARYIYDAFGNIVWKSDEWLSKYNDYRYAGYRYDSESGLYYLNQRYYNPRNGNFLSPDVVSGDLEDITSQNRYTYARNNPVAFIDPDGRIVWFAINAGLAVIDAYQTYQSGGSLASVVGSAALGFIGCGRGFKMASQVLGWGKRLLTPLKAAAGSVARLVPKAVKNRIIARAVGTVVSGGRIVARTAAPYIASAPLAFSSPAGRAAQAPIAAYSSAPRIVTTSQSVPAPVPSLLALASRPIRLSALDQRLVQALGTSMAPSRQQFLQSMLARAQKKNGLRLAAVKEIVRASPKTMEDLIGISKLLPKKGGPSTQYQLKGSYELAVQDFHSLVKKVVKSKPDIKIGVLPDGKTLVVRSSIRSSGGIPTLEFQPNKIKFRYIP